MLINMSDIDWQDIMIPFASAFAGAYFAYKFNSYNENKKNNEHSFKQFNILLNQINVVWMALLNYKIVYISNVEQILRENPELAIQQTIYTPDVVFKSNIEQNIFLAKYNVQFLLLLSEVEKQTYLTQKSINLCQEYFERNNDLYAINNCLPEKTIHIGMKTFELVKNYVDKSLSYLLLLREKLLKCKDLYFRFLYSDNRDILINHNFDCYLPDMHKFIEITYLSESIERSWSKPY